MATPFIGEIKMFGGNFAPRSYALCNGALQSIAQNTALFSILGTTYGGNGTTNFSLPDLQGRVPMHWGNGPGLTPRVLGEKSGTENVTLLSSNLPASCVNRRWQLLVSRRQQNCRFIAERPEPVHLGCDQHNTCCG
jgi:microcystin-dependent protein